MTDCGSITQLILSLETRALERWCNGDPSGYLEITAVDANYFDPFIERRIDGKLALAEYYGPLTGKIFAKHFEIINPQVQLFEQSAVLTFNYVCTTRDDQVMRWNCTEVYRLDPEGWRIIHSHWSRPALHG